MQQDNSSGLQTINNMLYEFILRWSFSIFGIYRPLDRCKSCSFYDHLIFISVRRPKHNRSKTNCFFDHALCFLYLLANLGRRKRCQCCMIPRMITNSISRCYNMFCDSRIRSNMFAYQKKSTMDMVCIKYIKYLFCCSRIWSIVKCQCYIWLMSRHNRDTSYRKYTYSKKYFFSFHHVYKNYKVL